MKITIYADPTTNKYPISEADILSISDVLDKPKTQIEVSNYHLYANGMRRATIRYSDNSIHENVFIDKKQVEMEILKQCTVEGKVVKLPEGQLDRKTYLDVKKAMELIGGKWKGGKVAGFVFQEDPTELLAQIANGEKRNLKKEYQFFATPPELADKLVALSAVTPDKLRDPKYTILEPSAGQGAILDALYRKESNIRTLFAYEIMNINRAIIERNYSDVILGETKDFLRMSGTKMFDLVIANPPFSKNQDITHVYQMYGVLKDGGRMVSVVSSHLESSMNTKEREFRAWLQKKKADIIKIEPEAFKESGTMVGGNIVVINK